MKHSAIVPATLAAVVVVAVPGAPAQQPADRQLIDALKAGGHVIVLRHARSPRDEPDERTADPDNTTRERQLDETGRQDAMAIGRAMRALGIPVGAVQTSPTYRARQTARHAGWEKIEPVPELGDLGRSMQGVTEVEGAWLRKRVAGFSPGTNVVLVTHLPNITRAFPQQAEGIEEGDALVFGPGSGSARLLGRIPVAAWRAVR